MQFQHNINGLFSSSIKYSYSSYICVVRTEHCEMIWSCLFCPINASRGSRWRPISTGRMISVQYIKLFNHGVLLRFSPEASFGFRVLSLPASVRVGVNHGLVRAITCHSFRLESPNLYQKCLTPWLRSLLFLGVIDLDLQGQIKLQTQNWPPFQACPHHYSPPIQVRISKSGSQMHLALVRSLLIQG